MNGGKQFPVLVTEYFAQLLQVDYDPTELEGYYEFAELPLTETAAEVLPQVNEVGQPLNLTFVHHRLPVEQLENLMNNTVLPVLIFPKADSGSPPILLKQVGRREVAVTRFAEDGPQDGLMNKQELLDFLQQDAPADGEISMITALKVEPTLSEADSPDLYAENLSPIKRFWRLILADKKDVALILIYAVAVGLLSLTLPLGVQAIVGMISGGLLLQPVVVLIIFVILGTLFSGLLQIYQMKVVEIVQQRVFTRAAFEFAFRIPRIRLEAVDKYYAPELMNRFFDILTIQKGFAKLLTDFSTSLLNVLFGLILLTFYHPFFVFFDLLLIAIVILVFRLTGPRGLRTSLAESDEKYKVAHWLEEMARTMISFKNAGFTNLGMNRMDKHVTQYLKNRKQHFNVLIGQFSSIVVFKTFITGGVLIIGSILVIDRQITLGQFVATEIVIVTIMVGVEKIIMSLESIYDVLTAAAKVGKVTDLPLDPNQGVHMRIQPMPIGVRLSTYHLTYKYPGNKSPSLKDISFDFEAGSRVALVGNPGSGKSTLLRIMSGVLHDYEGAVEYDGVLLKDLNGSSLRDQLGEALNDGEIFDGTLIENLTVGKSRLQIEDLKWAIEAAGLSDFVRKCASGLNTELLAAGGQLSTNIRRKIVLARSLAERPRLLLLDDGFVPLEEFTNNSLLPFLFDKKMFWTVVAATAHPDYVQRADRIIVLDEGKILFNGTYAELRKDKKMLAFLRNLQSGFSKD